MRLVPAEDASAENAHTARRTHRGGNYLSRDEIRERYSGVFDDLSAYEGGVVYDDTGYLDALDSRNTILFMNFFYLTA